MYLKWKVQEYLEPVLNVIETTISIVWFDGINNVCVYPQTSSQSQETATFELYKLL